MDFGSDPPRWLTPLTWTTSWIPSCSHQRRAKSPWNAGSFRGFFGFTLAGGFFLFFWLMFCAWWNDVDVIEQFVFFCKGWETFESSSHLIMLKYILKAYHAWKPQLCFQAWWMWLNNSSCQKWIDSEMDVSGNSGFSSKSSILIRVFHYIHHPFWGVSSIFELTPNGFLGILDVGALSDRSCQLHVQGLMPIPVRGCPVTSELRLKFVTSNSWQNAAGFFCWYILLLG